MREARDDVPVEEAQRAWIAAAAAEEADERGRHGANGTVNGNATRDDCCGGRGTGNANVCV
jgi:hypothetical protein